MDSIFMRVLLLFQVLLTSVGGNENENSGCTLLTPTLNQQHFTSHPDYPEINYPIHSDSCWLIQANSDYSVTLNVIDFELEESSVSCSQDALAIETGESGWDERQIGRFCGNMEDMVFETATFRGCNIKLNFSSGGSITHRGFNISYSLTPHANVSGEDACLNITLGNQDTPGTNTPENEDTDDEIPFYRNPGQLGLLGTGLGVALTFCGIFWKQGSRKRQRARQLQLQQQQDRHEEQVAQPMHGQQPSGPVPMNHATAPPYPVHGPQAANGAISPGGKITPPPTYAYVSSHTELYNNGSQKQ